MVSKNVKRIFSEGIMGYLKKITMKLDIKMINYYCQICQRIIIFYAEK